ncbi:alkane 1-monooxygenase 2 [Methyloglobulus morosus KoM1]|uniref:Alkane 1-monooxygenase 2 n=1 Tax=Methyloglobulus morosus KoM1 TaxID=1116472 RepID=V5C3D3_9GAMM|nr:fatty acid desaturase [Methyloglobulus morosus]ESS71333.1 alkane 1-monooxygenase 2 [Methyloglobulus morosus KoM1]
MHLHRHFKEFNHLLCFILPVSTCLFLTTGPHGIASALVWTTPFWLVLLADWLSPDVKPDTRPTYPQKFYDGILYALTVLQFANIFLMLEYVAKLQWESTNDIVASLVNLVIIRFLVGTSSGTSGIVVAHELIHRSQASWQLLGRLLLYTVCYEHFIITHKRGHHLELGLPDDIATARLGESFKDYWRRVYVGYLRYAWKSEQDRLALEPEQCGLVFYTLKNQVFQGLLVELALLLLIIGHYGWLAAFMFLYQAVSAVRILEAVNYFQHWGLENGQFGKTYGWVSHSLLSRYALISLPHHIGHHEDENKHYHEIAFSEQGPILPYGYFVMNLWVKLDNASYQKMAIKALELFHRSQN